MPQARGHRRKHSRSLSPVPSKHKRSWQNAAGDRFGGGGGRLQHHHRSPSPARGARNYFRPPARTNDRRNYHSSPGTLRKSRSPSNQKGARPGFSFAGRGAAPSYPRHSQLPRPGSRDKPASESHRGIDRSGSRLKQMSFSTTRPQQSNKEDRIKRDAPKARRLSPSPDPGPGPSTKKKPRHSASSLSPPPKRSRSRSPVSSAQTKKDSSSALLAANSIPQRKVSTASKRKPTRTTLHKRFTLEDQDPFELEENVTIAILRKPDAQPSEDVTVKRVFDASQFKMIHKKTEGRKPIFDREEIKVWRHDENLADDPDYERRLVRVKATSGTSKSTSDSVSQMSPDVIRKAIGLQAGGRSNRSPQMEPQIRMVPRPDPRYESKFRQQLEKEEELGRLKKKSESKRSAVVDKRSSNSDRGDKGGDVKDKRWEGEKRGDRGKEETYDLRQALERRRSDKEGSFRIEVRRDSNPEAELFYRDGQQRASQSVERRRFVQDSSEGGDRNVVLDQDRARRRFGGSTERDGGRSWRGRRFNDSRGYLGRGRGRRTDWNTDRGDANGGGREEGAVDFRDGGGNFERRQRFSNSPPSTRGWRGGFRGRGRGRFRDFVPHNQDLSPTEIDDSFKYSQHDDRDVSPKSLRGRGGRGWYTPRNFGSNNFRAGSRGGPRGGGRGYRGGGYRGGFISEGDNRSFDRQRDVSADREWKHDMYDSLQAEEEQPHSTTSGT